MMDQDSMPTGELETEVLQEDPTPWALPLGPIPVVLEGPVGVQHIPSRAAGGFQRKVSTSDAAVQLLGADPRRRVARIVSDLAFLYATDQASVAQGTAPLWPADVPLYLTHGEQLWLKTQAGSAVTAGEADTVVVTNPAAGADWTQDVPAGEFWTLQSWRGRFQTDATVANRQVNWRLERPAPGLEDLVTFTATVAQAASQIVVYQGTLGVGELPGVRNGGLQMMFPNGIVLEPGTRISSVTGSIQAGDTWTEIHLAIIRQTSSAATVDGTVSIDVENWAD